MLLHMCINTYILHTYIHRCIHICSYIHLELLLLLADNFQFKFFFQLDHRQMQGLAHLGKERERERDSGCYVCIYVYMYLCMYLCMYVCKDTWVRFHIFICMNFLFSFSS